MGTAKIHGESHCPVLFPISSLPIQLAVLKIAVCWRWAAQILWVGTTSDNWVLKWWLAFLHTALCTSSTFYFQPDLSSSTFVFAEEGTWSSFCTPPICFVTSSSMRHWSCSIPKFNSKISKSQPAVSTVQPLPTAETAEQPAGNHTHSSWHYQFLNHWHWIHSVLTGGKNNLYEPNTQLQVKLKALTD